MQIEMLRGDISYEELSQRLGPEMERCLARYVAGKTHLNEDDFVTIAKALSIEARILVRTWGTSLGLHLPNKGAVRWKLQRAYRDWRLHSHLPESCVPHTASPMAIIRAKYAGRLPRQTPLLWPRSHDCGEDTPEGREKFARGYEMLIQFVHDRHPTYLCPGCHCEPLVGNTTVEADCPYSDWDRRLAVGATATASTEIARKMKFPY
jgi:hypothetical protein